MPSSLRLYDAPVGHTGTHGGSSQCRQDLGKCSVSLCGYRPTSKVCTRLKKVPVGSAPYGRSSYSGPADPEVFHSLQLVTQAWQPTQTLRSMTSASWVIAHRLSVCRRNTPASPELLSCRDIFSSAQTAATPAVAHLPRPDRCARARRTRLPAR